MSGSCRYTERDLRREAVRVVKSDAKAAKVRARCVGYSVEIIARDDGHEVTRLVAHGKRADNGMLFDVTASL